MPRPQTRVIHDGPTASDSHVRSRPVERRRRHRGDRGCPRSRCGAPEVFHVPLDAGLLFGAGGRVEPVVLESVALGVEARVEVNVDVVVVCRDRPTDDDTDKREADAAEDRAGDCHAAALLPALGAFDLAEGGDPEDQGEDRTEPPDPRDAEHETGDREAVPGAAGWWLPGGFGPCVARGWRRLRPRALRRLFGGAHRSAWVRSRAATR